MQGHSSQKRPPADCTVALFGVQKAAFSLSLEWREGLCLVEEGVRGRRVWRRDVGFGKGRSLQGLAFPASFPADKLDGPLAPMAN